MQEEKALAHVKASDAMWRERLDGYKPWLSIHAWKPFWGPRPDASGTPNPMIPTAMLAAWKQEANKPAPSGSDGTQDEERAG